MEMSWWSLLYLIYKINAELTLESEARLRHLSPSSFCQAKVV